MSVDHGGTLGFLGYGNMGSAILEGLVKLGIWKAEAATIYDPAEERQSQAHRIGVHVADTPEALAAASDVLVLAVKPQTMADALNQIRAHVRPGTLVVSIAAGISTTYIRARLGDAVRVVRVMPNTPCLAHAGAAGISLGEGCTPADAELVARLFNAIGTSEVIDEKHMDALTAISGSGPAYFFYMVECLTDAGIEAGLDAHVSRRLAEQTLYGAGRLLHSSEDGAATLRERVTSRGGVTEAALRQFREEGLPDIVQRAVKAAVDRSSALGQ